MITICLDDLRTRSKVIELRCKHYFHKKCITPWVLTKGLCPVCKRIVFTDMTLDRNMPGNSAGHDNSSSGNEVTNREHLGELSRMKFQKAQ